MPFAISGSTGDRSTLNVLVNFKVQVECSCTQDPHYSHSDTSSSLQNPPKAHSNNEPISGVGFFEKNIKSPPVGPHGPNHKVYDHFLIKFLDTGFVKNEAVYLHLVSRFSSREYARIRSNSTWCSISVKIIICWNRLVDTPPRPRPMLCTLQRNRNGSYATEANSVTDELAGRNPETSGRCVCVCVCAQGRVHVRSQEITPSTFVQFV